MLEMFRPRPLFLFSVLVFHFAFGASEKVGKSEITEYSKNGNARTDAEQDPFTSITLALHNGDPHSELFSNCLTKSRTFESKFASIEVVPGSEYIRYVPSSFQLSFPVSWKSVNGSYSSILDCAKAVHDGGWSMFKYNGLKCDVSNTTYSLNEVPKCEGKDSDAVFILSTADEVCPVPRFLVGPKDAENPVCGLVKKDLMTYDEAKNFCLEVYPDEEFTLFVNQPLPLTMKNVTDTFTKLGYTNANLWVDADERGNTTADWYGDFEDADWWDGQFPVYPGSNVPYRAAYLDKDSNFKLRVSDRSFKASVLCITKVVANSTEVASSTVAAGSGESN